MSLLSAKLLDLLIQLLLPEKTVLIDKLFQQFVEVDFLIGLWRLAICLFVRLVIHHGH